MNDSDLLINNNESDHSFVGVVTDMIGKIHYKLFMFIFIIFLLLSSDTFINRILNRVSGAVEYKSPTSYGVTLQATLLILCCVILQLLIDYGVL